MLTVVRCTDRMKTTKAYIFVDDGYPEASEYDNNFIAYDPAIQGSCKTALFEAETRVSKKGVSHALFFKSSHAA